MCDKTKSIRHEIAKQLKEIIENHGMMFIRDPETFRELNALIKELEA